MNEGQIKSKETTLSQEPRDGSGSSNCSARRTFLSCMFGIVAAPLLLLRPKPTTQTIEWISVKDRLPPLTRNHPRGYKESEVILVSERDVWKDGSVHDVTSIGVFTELVSVEDGEKYWRHAYFKAQIGGEVTHWTPVPTIHGEQSSETGQYSTPPIM